MSERICKHPPCSAAVQANGFCSMHYHRDKRGQDMDAPPKRVPGRTCSQDGCDRPHRAQGLCEVHYWRSRHGVPLEVPLQVQMHGASASQRFWARVDRTGDCWLWLGSTNARGYGTFVAQHPRRIGAHRFAYEEARGPIAEGMEIDHLCRNPSCVRPDHMEVVAHEENMRRMSGPRGAK